MGLELAKWICMYVRTDSKVVRLTELISDQSVSVVSALPFDPLDFGCNTALRRSCGTVGNPITASPSLRTEGGGKAFRLSLDWRQYHVTMLAVE